MRFKLIIAMVDDDKTDLTLDTARAEGATGCTVITNARGEGLEPQKTFLGLSVAGQRDVVLLLVEEHMSRQILEAIGKACQFEEQPGTGVAFQIDIEDAIGLRSQIKKIEEEIDEGDL